MPEKVLGFYEKDAAIMDAQTPDKISFSKIYSIEITDLVLVHLKSESVTLEWLEKEIKDKKKECLGNKPTDYEQGRLCGKQETLEWLERLLSKKKAEK